MPPTLKNKAPESEVDILARVFDRNGRLPASQARYILHLGFSDEEQARVHDLIVRNQEDALLPGEKEELLGYVKADSLLGILKSKARQALQRKSSVSRER
jgi:hypothetical protein